MTYSKGLVTQGGSLLCPLVPSTISEAKNPSLRFGF